MRNLLSICCVLILVFVLPTTAKSTSTYIDFGGEFTRLYFIEFEKESYLPEATAYFYEYLPVGTSYAGEIVIDSDTGVNTLATVSMHFSNGVTFPAEGSGGGTPGYSIVGPNDNFNVAWGDFIGFFTVGRFSFPADDGEGFAYSGNGNGSFFLAGDGEIYVAADGTGCWGEAGVEGTIDRAKISTTSSAVPEPSTMLLLGSGLIGLAGYGRKKFLKK